MAERPATSGRLASVLVGILCCGLAGTSAAAQANSNSSAALSTSETVPFRARVIDYGNLTAPLTVAFRYAPLVPGAAGEAEIVPGPTRWKLNAVFRNLPPASKLGSEYLTYVLWCVTPEGRSLNLGEVELIGTDGHVKAKVNLQRFGLIVTAEPYLAVGQPNKAVVLEADVAPGSATALPVTEVACELLSAPIGAGTVKGDPPPTDPAAPVEIEEARRAIGVARAAGAEQYAPNTFATAERLLHLAEDQQARGVQRKDVTDTASEAAFIAEDARVLAVSRKERASGDRAGGTHEPSP